MYEISGQILLPYFEENDHIYIVPQKNFTLFWNSYASNIIGKMKMQLTASHSDCLRALNFFTQKKVYIYHGCLLKQRREKISLEHNNRKLNVLKVACYQLIVKLNCEPKKKFHYVEKKLSKIT